MAPPAPPQPAPSQNAFFSPQTAFYAPTPNPGPGGMPGMDFLNNPLVSVGFNVVEQGMKDFTGKTVNMLPNEVCSILTSMSFLQHDENVLLR